MGGGSLLFGNGGVGINIKSLRKGTKLALIVSLI